MARMTSLIASQIRGSIGGVTYTATRTKSIVMKVRQGPKRIMTNLQVLVRTSMSAAIAAWNGLAQSDRDAWASYAASLTFTSPLGDTYSPTGLQAFIRSYIPVTYMNEQLAAGLDDDWNWGGVVQIGEPNVGPIKAATPAGPGTGFGISIAVTPNLDMTAFIRVSSSYTAAREKSPGRWISGLTQIAALTGATTNLIDILDLVEGGVYFASVRVVQNQITGLDTPPLATKEFVIRAVAEVVAA